MDTQHNQSTEDDGLSTLKMLVGISAADTDQDEKLKWILSAAKSRLKLLLGGIEPPAEMAHIPVEVAVARFNRISSEGMSINNVEGESQHFQDNDFKNYMSEIQVYLDALNAEKRKGGIKFL